MNKGARQARAAGEPPLLVRRLNDLTERLDHLENRIEDVTEDGSKRVLDRMHHLEAVTRKQCQKLIQIHDRRSAILDGKFKNCEAIVLKAEAKCASMEASLERRGDRERKETAELLSDLKAAIAVVDQQACSAVVALDRKVEEVKFQLASLDVTVKEVSEFCERAEAAAARAQEFVRDVPSQQTHRWMSSAELKEVAVSRARSLGAGGRSREQLVRCIDLAKETFFDPEPLALGP